MTVNAIITPQELIEWSINQDLIDLTYEEMGKYINIVSARIWAKIDEDQFKKEDGTYEYPADLKLATISLVDSYYAYAVQLGMSSATGRRTSRSEKIDDYQITEAYDVSSSAFSFYGIPTDLEILDILKKYMSADSYGFRDIDLH